LTFAPLAIGALLAYASLVDDVRTSAAHRDFAAAERAVRAYQAQNGRHFRAGPRPFPGWPAASLRPAGTNQADAYAAEARRVAGHLPGEPESRSKAFDRPGRRHRGHAQVLAARGERTQAGGLLASELAAFGKNRACERIRKNINLLG